MLGNVTALAHGIEDESTQRAIRALEKRVNELIAVINVMLTPTEGVAVDLAEVHAALVARGLITL